MSSFLTLYSKALNVVVELSFRNQGVVALNHSQNQPILTEGLRNISQSVLASTRIARQIKYKFFLVRHFQVISF